MSKRNCSVFPVHYFNKISSPLASHLLAAFEAIKSCLRVTFGRCTGVSDPSSLFIVLETVPRGPYERPCVFFQDLLELD